MARAKTPYQLCLATLRAVGLLMLNDEGEYPSVELAVAAAVGRGAKWSDPAASQADAVKDRLLRHRDVLAMRFISSKTTLIHRSLWPDLLAMATSGAPWQVEWLPRREAELLELVEAEGSVVVDRALAERFDASPRHFGKSLESRLLVLCDCVGKAPGERRLTSWWSWAEEKRVAPAQSELDARVRLEIAGSLAARWPNLPWFRASVRRRF